MIDVGRDPRVRDTQQISPALKRSCLCDLQMLPWSNRVAPPSIIRKVRENRRFGELFDDFLTKNVLVTDVHTNFFLLPLGTVFASLAQAKSLTSGYRSN